MSREPMDFADLPLSIKLFMIAGAIFLGPYLIIRALIEEKLEASR